MGTVRHLGWKMRGPLIGLVAALIALLLGGNYLLSASVFLFVGVLAWMAGLRMTAADRRDFGRGDTPPGLIGGDGLGGGGGG